jgi:hypothetical protein
MMRFAGSEDEISGGFRKMVNSVKRDAKWFSLMDG